ncbi:hypothetical protein SDC9_190512 [bioreactor metagenome]|uniref:Uncharacterized protein n=1 Tax=bioreactor metagenome TaxID=1076179 RepID=A0A645I3G8_9ZZZZ
MHREVPPGTFAPDGYRGFFSRFDGGYFTRKVGGIGHFAAVYSQDNVTGFQAGLVRGLPGQNVAHEGAFGLGKSEGLRAVFIQALDGHAHPAARDFPARPQGFDDFFRHVAGDGKADSLAVGDDGGVDADDFARHVDERAAAVAGVDRGVCL